MNSSFPTVLIGMGLLLLQIFAAIPWLLVLFAKREVLVQGIGATIQKMLNNRAGQQLLGYIIGGTIVFSGLVPLIFNYFVRDPEAIDTWGRIYGAVLQIQLMFDFFILVFPLVLLVWPKGGAIAQAAFREGVRQPMFWLLLSLATLALFSLPFVPYFTFGEDYEMVQELGPDTILLFAVLFGVLAASMFVSEEIEGRTAVTLMSKPVSRRQFLLGKFVGIFLVVLLMYGLLGTVFEGSLLMMRYLFKLDPITIPTWVTTYMNFAWLPDGINQFLRGTGAWTDHTGTNLPGLLLSFGQVMILVSIAVALATRVPMVVNLPFVIMVYVSADLTPHLVANGKTALEKNPSSIVAQMLSFVVQVFETVLPGLEFLRLGSVSAAEQLPFWPFVLYLLSATFYALLYTLIVILFGLVLFEDRDLA